MKKITKYIIIGCFLIGGLATGSLCQKQYRLQQQLAEKVLRFHVMANSDTVEDQRLKLKVRDAVGGFMQENMQNITSKEACEGFVTAQIPKIEQVAKAVVKEAGYDYEIHAE